MNTSSTLLSLYYIKYILCFHLLSPKYLIAHEIIRKAASESQYYHIINVHGLITMSSYGCVLLKRIYLLTLSHFRDRCWIRCDRFYSPIVIPISRSLTPRDHFWKAASLEREFTVTEIACKLLELQGIILRLTPFLLWLLSKLQYISLCTFWNYCL